MRHLYKIFAVLVVLVIMLGIYKKAKHADEPLAGFDVPVSAATRHDNSPAVRSHGSLTATRPSHALSAEPSAEAWSEAIDTVLRDDTDSTAKSKRLIEMYGHLPASLQTEAAQHLVNFATDEHPEPVLEPLMKSGSTETAQGVLLLGLLQREDSIRLPALLQLARDPDHTANADALQYLHFLLEQNHGNDWTQWEHAIEARLKTAAD
jgi:hypothetical protein